MPRETIEELLDIARFAPSAVNVQGVHWTVVADREDVHRLAGLVIDWMRDSLERSPHQANALGLKALVEDWELGHDRILRDAPVVVAAHAPTGAVRGDVNGHIALTYLELAAFAHGLGACWAGYLYGAMSAYPPVAEFLRIPADHQAHGAMMLGYPKHHYLLIPARNALEVDWV